MLQGRPRGSLKGPFWALFGSILGHGFVRLFGRLFGQHFWAPFCGSGEITVVILHREGPELLASGSKVLGISFYFFGTILGQFGPT